MRNKLNYLFIALCFLCFLFAAMPAAKGQYTPISNLGTAVGDTAIASSTKYYYLAAQNNYASLFMGVVRVKTLAGTATGTMVLETALPPSISTTDANAFWAPVGATTALTAGAIMFYRMDYLTFSERRIRLKVVTTSATQTLAIQTQGGLRRRTAY